MYQFCEDHDVPHERCGKLVVAGSVADIAALEALAVRAQQNGVDDLTIIDRAFLRRLEPHVEGVAALWSPSTGIVEAEALVRALTRAARRNVHLLPGTRVTGGTPGSDGIELLTNHERLLSRVVVNASGLYADEVSTSLGGEAFAIYPVRGEYAELLPRARHLVTRPVYPLPDQTGLGLGVHLTRTTWGSVMLGPTARYQTLKDDYEGNRLPLEHFHESARRLVPELKLDDLRPGSTGIRARPAPATEAFADFIVRADTQIPGLIHAAGIDSPGLTACLSIAQMIVGLVDRTLS